MKRWFYGLYVMHALSMPDTPTLAALRERIDAWGMFPVLDHVISLSSSPRHFADGLAVCFEALFDGLYETLMEQLAADPAHFRIPGDRGGTASFVEAWTRTLRERTRRARNGRLRAVRTPGRRLRPLDPLLHPATTTESYATTSPRSFSPTWSRCSAVIPAADEDDHARRRMLALTLDCLRAGHTGS